MADPVVEALIIDLLAWLSKEERTYQEVMDAWRTSCPKLPVWEDANDRELVAEERVDGRRIVRVTSAGRALLEQRLSSISTRVADTTLRPPPTVLT